MAVCQVVQQVAITEFELQQSLESRNGGSEEGGDGGSRLTDRAYRCSWKAKGLTVLLREKPDEYERELQAVGHIRHANIIELYATTSQNEFIPHFYIVTEFAENGSLFDYFQQQHKQPDLEKSMKWAKDVANGAAHLHQCGQAHRELRSCNVLLTSDWTAKISFFGSTKGLKHTPALTSRSGWMAPEMLREILLFHKQDVFFFGVLLWELITHDVPYSGLSHMQVILEVGKKGGLRPEIPGSCQPRLKQLIEDCWQDDPEKRPEFTEILSTLHELS